MQPVYHVDVGVSNVMQQNHTVGAVWGPIIFYSGRVRMKRGIERGLDVFMKMKMGRGVMCPLPLWPMGMNMDRGLGMVMIMDSLWVRGLKILGILFGSWKLESVSLVLISSFTRSDNQRNSRKL
jgi:hypothetical protein